MSRTRVFARLGVAVGAVLALVWVSSPAFAADAVELSISNLSSTLTAGANRADGFRTTMKNRTDADIQPIRRFIVVHLPGIKPENVRIFQGLLPLQSQSAGADQVRVADSLQVHLGPHNKANDESRQDFAIQLGAGTPNGRGEVIFQAYRGEQLLGSTSKNITVRGGTAQASPTPSATKATRAPTASATQDQVVPNDTGGITIPVTPLSDKKASADTSGSSIPVVFYVLGAILVVAGGGILWLLFRPRPALVADSPTGAYEPVRPPAAHYAPDPAPTLGYPRLSPPAQGRPGATTHPTTVMPTVRGTASPPPPVDPWATQGGASDSARGFPRD